METDIPGEGRESVAEIKENDFLLKPVSPYSFGEGLPYAPIHWPNFGDNWSWKVGKRSTSSGFYCDRYLYLPKSLQKPGHIRAYFASKPSVARYIQTEFPGADVDSFFASFSWRIPSKNHCWTEGKAIRLCRSVTQEADKVRKEREKPEKPLRKRKSKPPVLSSMHRHRRQTRQSLKQFLSYNTRGSAVPIDVCSSSRDTASSDSTPPKDFKSCTDFGSDQVSGHPIAISPAGSSIAACHSSMACELPSMDSPHKSWTEMIPEDFDKYLNSLEDIIAHPLFENLSAASTMNISPSLEELAEARNRLCFLLSMGVPSLASSQSLAELTILSSRLQKDPNLSADQLSKLKLIEEIPLAAKDFLEAKRNIELANQFFADLEANVVKATLLRNEYNDSKEKASQIMAEVDSSLSAIQEIDDQIARLQSRRDELASAMEIQKKVKLELSSTQRMVADTLPKVVHEIQLANSKKLEWELKKNRSAKLEAEVLARFAPLDGFSL